VKQKALRRRYGGARTVRVCTPCGSIDLPPGGTPVFTGPSYEAFRKAHPAIRNFQHYTSDQRAQHAASHRLTPHRRQAAGEFFYTHPMIPGRAFDTAKQATTAAFALASVTS